MVMPKWRKMTWVLVLWCALILVWAIAGAGTADCAGETGGEFLSDETAQDACEAGTGIGVAIVLLFGFFGFVFFGMIWLFTRPRVRDCPRCGNDVKKGVMVCASCGFDYNSILPQNAQNVAPPTSQGPPPPRP